MQEPLRCGHLRGRDEARQPGSLAKQGFVPDPRNGKTAGGRRNFFWFTTAAAVRADVDESKNGEDQEKDDRHHDH